MVENFDENILIKFSCNQERVQKNVLNKIFILILNLFFPHQIIPFLMFQKRPF